MSVTKLMGAVTLVRKTVVRRRLQVIGEGCHMVTVLVLWSCVVSVLTLLLCGAVLLWS